MGPFSSMVSASLQGGVQVVFEFPSDDRVPPVPAPGRPSSVNVEQGVPPFASLGAVGSD